MTVTTGLPVHGDTPSRGRKGWESCSSGGPSRERSSRCVSWRGSGSTPSPRWWRSSPLSAPRAPAVRGVRGVRGMPTAARGLPVPASEMKREILREAFRRIGKTDVAPETAPPREPFGYRYRGRFRWTAKRSGSSRSVPAALCRSPAAR